MHGFFTKKESQSTVKIHKGKMPSCIACGLYKGGCSSPKMEPSGKFKKGILNIFDYPIPLEDEKGSLFAGVMGQRMKQEFRANGFDIIEDCLNTTAIKCMPMEGEPTPFQIESCRGFIMALIKKHKPKLINVFGKYALMSLIANRWNNEIGKIDKWRGFVIPDQEFKCWVAPMYNPAFVIEKESKAIDLIFKNDLKRAFDFYDNPVYIHTEPNIKIINNLKVLSKIKNNTDCAIDYETTGLKPHKEGHKIVCASIATSPDDVYVFMMPDDEIKRRPYLAFVRNQYIKKMAHNAKFEQNWTKNILGTLIKGWKWDSMIAAHIIDNRRDITGLKFQTYVNFGVIDYNLEVKEYLQGIEPDNANSMNRLLDYIKRERNREELLIYNAYDSIHEYRLAQRQQFIMDNILPF